MRLCEIEVFTGHGNSTGPEFLRFIFVVHSKAGKNVVTFADIDFFLTGTGVGSYQQVNAGSLEFFAFGQFVKLSARNDHDLACPVDDFRNDGAAGGAIWKI